MDEIEKFGLKKRLYNLNNSLFENIEELKGTIIPILETISETFPDYTKHNIDHSERVIKNLNLIISEKLMNELNEYEIFFLLAAAYLHDIGMANLEIKKDNEMIKKLSEEEKKNHIRDNHHILSEEFINKEYRGISIKDHHQAGIIGKLCRGHRKIDIESYNTDFIYRDNPINLAFLTIFLQIADELDISFDRIPMTDGSIILPADKVSREHWEAHLTIAGVNISENDPLTIKASAVCKDPKIHRTLKRLETKINYQIGYLPHFIKRYRKCIRELPRDFKIEIEPVGYTPYDFKFSLESNQLIELLKENKLYSNEEVAIRELLKNALDACKYKEQICLDEGRLYSAQIFYKLSDDKSELIVEDNGIGMNLDIIDRYFTKIGRSFYNTFLSSESFNFTPVSELGIGVLSYFLLANKIVIETKMDDSDPISIEIVDISDYFIVREGSRKDSGTAIKLLLKDQVKDKIEFSVFTYYRTYATGTGEGYYYPDRLYLVDSIEKYATHVSFPIRVVHDVFEEEIKNKDYSLDYSSKEYYLHQKSFNFDYAEGRITFFLNKSFQEKKQMSFNVKYNNSYPFSQIPNLISYEGIFVQNYLDLEVFLPNFVMYDLNFRNNAIDLNLARDRIVVNDKFKIIKEKLESFLIEELTVFLKKIQDESVTEKQNYRSVINEFFRNRISSYLPYIAYSVSTPLVHSKSFKETFREFYFFKLFSDGNFNYKKIKELSMPIEEFEVIFTTKENGDENIKSIIVDWEEYDNSKAYIISYYDLIWSTLFDDCTQFYIDLEEKTVKVREKPNFM